MPSILVVDDYQSERFIMADPLIKEGYDVNQAVDGQDGLKKLKEKSFDMIITDLKMPKMNGIELLREAKRLHPHIVVILVTAYGTLDEAVEAMKEGAYDFIKKPIDPDELKIKIKKALEQLRMIDEREYFKEEIKGYLGEMVGQSKPMRQIQEAISTIAKSDVPVLIRGENGVGKELVARAIHEQSSRKGPFVAVSLSAIPETLIESELFGHEKGAFTGALFRRIGRFELASSGSLFLDEIGEISPSLQIKLLRVLQEKEFQRIGGTVTLKTEARIIAATNQDLEERIREGRFREDLYYRLNVFPVYVLPLRERKEDIPLLARHFIKKYNLRLGKEIEDISDEAIRLLCDYDWPGNIRELENIIQRAIITSKGDVITSKGIFLGGVKAKKEASSFEEVVEGIVSDFDFDKGGLPLWEQVMSALAVRMVERCGEKAKAAQMLGISKPTLYHWLRKAQIEL